MGLDMYLDAEKYLSQYVNDGTLYKQINESIKLPGQGEMPIKTITCEAMYWRKANAIHNWFVQNVQEGKDDCRRYYVDIEQLKELLESCRAVVADPEKAESLLPPVGGFFFGSTEIDEYYIQDLKNTIDGLEKLLSTPDIEKWDFYYHSSW